MIRQGEWLWRHWGFGASVVICTVILVSPSLGARGGAHVVDSLALGKESYMVRLTEDLPPAAYANDGNLDTVARTTDRTADGYWEVDLGQAFAVTRVQVAVPAGYEQRLSHATLRLFDERHDSVYSRRLGAPASFYDLDCGGPRRARYVRVGFERKERSSPDGSIEWALGLAEVMVFGDRLDEVGLLALDVAPAALGAGQAATLSWQVAGVQGLLLYPGAQPLTDQTGLDGTGQWSVAPADSTEFLLVADGTLGREVGAGAVIVDGHPLTVRLNEFVARNRFSLEDGFGNDPDWIELYNPSDTPQDLAGYALSDDPNRPAKWVLPPVTVPGHGTLIVFASGEDTSPDPGGFLHAPFRLDGDGGSVLLTAPDGGVRDEVIGYPPQTRDLAYGRGSDGTWTFLEPTPGAVNLARSYAGWLEPVSFNEERGLRETPFTLSLNHPDPEAEIRLSLDGREPSLPYTGPLMIDRTVTVRAVAQRPGYRAAPVQTHSFVFVDEVADSAGMDPGISQDPRFRERLRSGLRELPSLCVAVRRPPDDYIPSVASVEVLWPDGSASVQADCEMVRFGGSWTDFPKAGYRFKFRGELGTSKLRADLFTGFERGVEPAAAYDELEIYGGNHDMNQRGFYMAAPFVQDSMLDMGSLNPHGRFVHVYLNGTYWGMYFLRERLVSHMLADYLGGRSEDYLRVRGNDNVGSGFVLGTPDPVYRHTWQAVLQRRGSYQNLRPYVDVSHLIDFMLLWFYGNCEAEYRAAGPVEPGSGFKFWIADADGFLRTSALNRNNTGNAGPAGIFGSLVAERDPEFLMLLADRIDRHLRGEGALTPAANRARLTQRMDEIHNALVAECARWRFRTPDNWEAAATNIIENLFPARTEQLLGYCRQRGWIAAVDPPVFSQAGGTIGPGFTLSLASPRGTIYYTLDGSDPRGPGGQPAAQAQIYRTAAAVEDWIPAGATWRYWDRGSEPGGEWRAPTYDDTTWAVGRAQLGYGDGDEATTVSYGPDSHDKYRTTYFRHTFTADSLSGVTALTLRLVRDDGARVTLNGTEIARSNLPSGPVTFDTAANGAVGGGEESQWFSFSVGTEALRVGTNALAVEIHQSSPTSSDISFDLSLQAARSAAEQPLVLTGSTTVRARVLLDGQWSALAEAQFTWQP